MWQGEILNCAEIKIALLLITHTIARPLIFTRPLKSVGLHLCTKRKRLSSVTFPIELNVTLGHAHFQGNLFLRLLGIPHTKLYIKFEVSSSSSFGAIDAAMVE